MGASIGWGVFFERVLTVCFRFLALRMLTTSKFIKSNISISSKSAKAGLHSLFDV